MKKVLIFSNSDQGLYLFRKELLEKLTDRYCVIISVPEGPYIKQIQKIGCKIYLTKVYRRSINPINDIKLLLIYRKLIKTYNPDVLLTYTIKPNIYGGMIARLYKTPYITNITGLGTAFEKTGLLQFIIIRLYKSALKKADTIFFQNKKNMEFMLDKEIKGKSYKLLPGSGVNLSYFSYLEYPSDENLHFLFIGRVMKAKGIDNYLEAAKSIKQKYSNITFHVLGEYEENYKTILERYQTNGYIEYHGRISDVRKYFEIAHAIIHPTYHEGMSNVLLEAAACGRPILASNVPGCIEIFDEGITGIGFEPKNTESLINAIASFIKLSYREKEKMGLEGRKKIVEEFDRNFVVNSYMNILSTITNCS